ncbi:hypothetical protein L3X38_037947 [Prunus dulcis]|uniref:Uncharacterized protein n=1 Tax=Prunus dulcis TaxID=3755 RepID=A0AAD4V4D5_PRUDU|nr:hypothetical protein L3X38_037947 [Prunus dulcis]
MPKARGVELFTVIGDNCIQEAEAANDILLYELLNFSCGDRCQGFRFDLLREVVHIDDREFDMSLALWHEADEFESIIVESRPIVTSPNGFKGQGSSTKMTAISSFVNFSMMYLADRWWMVLALVLSARSVPSVRYA